MQIRTILLSFAAMYLLGGCGGSATTTSTDTVYTKTIGQELRIAELKDLYYLGEDATPSFVAVNEYGIDISEWVTVTGTIDTSKEGLYRLTFSLMQDNRVIDSVEKEIRVVANQAPVITLYGGEQVDLYLGESYSELGYEATDAEDGDITARVVVSGSVDSAQTGSYTLTYTVTDSYGNQTSLQRVVRVIPKDDIRVNVIAEDTTDGLMRYDLWEYMLNPQNTTYTYTYYVNNLKEYIRKNELSQLAQEQYQIALPYTLRTLRYTKNSDATITVDFMQDQDIVKSVSLNENVYVGDIITMQIPVDESQACRVSAHYQAIELADIRYDDVLKISCAQDEAYYAKNYGIILHNRLVADNTLSTSSVYASGVAFEPIVYSVKTPLGELNLESMIQSHSDMLAGEPYNLDGTGIKVGIVDEGNVRDTHIELVNRVVNLTEEVWLPDGSKAALAPDDYASHATHVAGTIGATGINADARGYASKVGIETLSFNDTVLSAFSYGMERFRIRGIYLTNHSYDEVNASKAGLYAEFAHKADALVERYPELLAVASSGNDRTDTNRYGLVKDFGNAKNIITVGAVNYDDTLSAFSNTGPVRNGRIKPDIVAKGANVLSLDAASDDGYIVKYGTSMAAPAVTGALALLEQEYLKINHERMHADVAKALLANTAVDLGRAGPDYEYGFGLLNTLEAVNVIDTMDDPQPLVQRRTIAPEQKHTYDLHLDALTEVKLTLCWIDPETGFVPVEELVADLDVRIVDQDANTVYAFTLDPDNPESVARQDQFNRVDNVEQVVAKLPRGDYQVIVSVHKAGKVEQKYALVSNVALSNFQSDSSYSEIKEFETVIYESLAQ